MIKSFEILQLGGKISRIYEKNCNQDSTVTFFSDLTFEIDAEYIIDREELDAVICFDKCSRDGKKSVLMESI